MTSPCGGLGRTTVDQRVPSHRSARPPFEALPVAVIANGNAASARRAGDVLQLYPAREAAVALCRPVASVPVLGVLDAFAVPADEGAACARRARHRADPTGRLGNGLPDRPAAAIPPLHQRASVGRHRLASVGPANGDAETRRRARHPVEAAHGRPRGLGNRLDRPPAAIPLLDQHPRGTQTVDVVADGGAEHDRGARHSADPAGTRAGGQRHALDRPATTNQLLRKAAANSHTGRPRGAGDCIEAEGGRTGRFRDRVDRPV